MGELKPGWRRVKFAQLAESVNERVDDPSKSGVDRYVGLDHLDPESLTIRRWGAPDEVESTKLRFKTGDIIFGKRRAYQRKLAVADFEGICSAHAMVLRAKPSAVLPEFLPFFMQSDTFMERAVAISVGSLSPTINWKTLAAQEFSLPPMGEQSRIVSALRAATTVVERLKHVVEAAGRVRMALAAELMAAVPASELRPLRTCCSRVGVGIASSAAHAYRDSGVPMIRNTDIEPGRINTSDLLYIDPVFDSENASKRVRSGDVVVARTGVPGTAAVVPPNLDLCQTFTTLIVSPRREILDSEFLAAWINGPVSQSFIRSRKGGGVQQNMNAGLLELLPTWTPSLARQREVVSLLGAASECVESALRRRNIGSALLRDLVNGPQTYNAAPG